MIKALFMDFDGTLADVVPLVLKSVNKLSNKYNFNKIKLTKTLKSKDLKTILKQDLNLRYYRIPKFIREVKTIFNQEILKVKIFPNLKPVLKDLSKLKKLVILTSNDKIIVKSILKNNSINFINSIYSTNYLFGKKSIFKKSLRDLNLSTNNIVYLTDEIRDLKTCKELNIKTIAVTWGFNSKSSLKKQNPDYLINKPKDLLKILK